MIKEDNDWGLEYLATDKETIVTINKNSYLMKDEMAGLTHAILLLVDAVNDKYIPGSSE